MVKFLLNLDLVEFIIEEAIRRNEQEKRNLAFVLATNLAVLDDRALALAARHQVLVSTSLDGPADLHNKNRPRPGGDFMPEQSRASIAPAWRWGAIRWAR